MKTIKEKIPSLIISLILASLGFGLKYFGMSDQKSIVIATSILIISFLISINIYRPIRRALIISFTKAEVEEDGPHKSFYDFKEKLNEMIGESLQADMAKNAGLSGWHSSLIDAQNEIIEYVKTSQNIKLITNTGITDIGKGSKYYDAFSKNKTAEIKVLMSAVDSPFISEKWALQNKFKKGQSKVWVKRVKDTINDIQYLKTRHKITLLVRFYKAPFTWHLWIFNENTAFITSWMKSEPKPRVYKCIKTSDHALFEMFNYYFERMWNEQSYK